MGDERLFARAEAAIKESQRLRETILVSLQEASGRLAILKEAMHRMEEAERETWKRLLKPHSK
jgi:hypothetical protein